MWSPSQINHQKTADPQNMAFGGFYALITRNRRALWMVHQHIDASDIHRQHVCTAITFISAFQILYQLMTNCPKKKKKLID